MSLLFSSAERLSWVRPVLFATSTCLARLIQQSTQFLEPNLRNLLARLEVHVESLSR